MGQKKSINNHQSKGLDQEKPSSNIYTYIDENTNMFGFGSFLALKKDVLDQTWLKKKVGFNTIVVQILSSLSGLTTGFAFVRAS